MRNCSRVRIWLFAAIIGACGFIFFAPAVEAESDGFGFNYWPHNSTGCSDSLTDANWASTQKSVAADLDLMRSLGAKVIRLTIWPMTSGFAEGWPLDTTACAHLPDMISMIKNRGFKIIIAFSNSYLSPIYLDTIDNKTGMPIHLSAWQILTKENDENGKPQLYYATNPDGFTIDQRPYTTSPEAFIKFLNDSDNWINSIVNLTQGGGDAILYYDIQNEYDSRALDLDWYFTNAFLWTDIPSDKIGISVLRVPEDVDGSQWAVLQKLAVAEENITFIDFHSYPVVPSFNCFLNPNIEATYDYIAQRFPGTTVIMGEFGRRAITKSEVPQDNGTYPSICPRGIGTPPSFFEPINRSWDELSQDSTVSDLIERAAAKNIPYFLHWMLWDNSPRVDVPNTDSAAQVYGIGYNPHKPKNILGTISALNSIISNPDMEDTYLGKPVGWKVRASGPSGPIPVQLYASGYGTPDAATHDYYARVQTSLTCGAPCTAWLESDKFQVQGGMRLFVNAFIRSLMSDISIDVIEYDASDNQLNVVQGPRFNSQVWAWNNYLQRIEEQNNLGPNGWSVLTNPDTKSVAVRISGTPTSPYLDVDTVSLSQYACMGRADTLPCDGCVDTPELNAFLYRWKVNSSNVVLRELIEAIGLWRKGC